MNIGQGALNETVYRVAPQGRLDAVTVPEFETVLDQSLAAGHLRLVVDLVDVTYVSSSGLRALLRARRQAQAGGGDVVLCDMNPRVREVFEMIGFTSLFRIFSHADEAAAALTKTIAA